MDYNIERFVQEALAEDTVDYTGKIPPGDHTSLACINKNQQVQAHLICKAGGVLAGVELAEIIFRKVDASVKFSGRLQDGAPIKIGDIAFNVEGNARSILLAERLVLNFMQRMSGIATHTSRFVERVKGTGAKILDTRKTTPNFRFFEKWAVSIGGGHNYRFGLYDMIMLKDNHIDFCGGITKAINAVKEYQLRNNLHLPVVIETRSIHDIEEVLAVGNINRIMFDNFSVQHMRMAIELVAHQYATEASGGMTLETVRQFAETGVDFISVGAITHSSASLDLSLKAI